MNTITGYSQGENENEFVPGEFEDLSAVELGCVLGARVGINVDNTAVGQLLFNVTIVVNDLRALASGPYFLAISVWIEH